jgi:tripartite-type tricarboxylate transporter receptor subunit TctC
MNAEKFRMAAGIQAEHIAFKGTPEATTETMTGRVEWFFAPLVSATSALCDGKPRALAVGSKERSSILQDVPTTEEAGVPGSAFNFWIGLWAPAKTPPDVVERLSAAVQEALKALETRERLSKLGADPMFMTPPQFEAFLADEFKSNENLVKSAGIKLTN